MEDGSDSPWFKSTLKTMPAYRKFMSPSSLGGASSCLFKYAITSLRDELIKYTPPTYYSSWGRVYHALREKAFSQKKYDLILKSQLDVEDGANGKDWLKSRLVPLKNFSQVREKIAIDSKIYRSKLPELDAVHEQALNLPSSIQEFEYIREKFFPEKGFESLLPFRGRVDCILRWRDGSYIIRDYKTGSVFEPNGNFTYKISYVKQLHAYALLTTECYGLKPKHMELIDATGRPHVITFDDSIANLVIKEAQKNLELIDEVLKSFVSDLETSKFCTPSLECCEHCKIKPYCKSYWSCQYGVKLPNKYNADIKGVVSSSFNGYSQVGQRADLRLHIGNQTYISLLIPSNMVATHPVLSEWIRGRIPNGTTIYILSAQPTLSRTQFILKDETVICVDRFGLT